MIIRPSIKNKIIILFIAINLLFALIFVFNNYINEQKMQNRDIENEKNEIIQVSLIKATLSLLDYHKKVLQGEFIDPQSYLAIVREISSSIIGTKLLSLKSYIKIDNKFIITASSATKEEFKAQSYPQYGEIATNSKILSDSYSAKNFQDIYDGQNVAMSFNLKDIKYVVLATIKNKSMINEFTSLSTFLQILTLLSILAILLLSLLVNYIIKQIKDIDSTMKSFFIYLKENGDKDKIKYIQKTSLDELGILSKNINRGIKDVVSKIDNDNDNSARDDILLGEINEAIKPTCDGVFKQEIISKASNPKLNELKSGVNNQMKRVDLLLNNIDNSIKKYLDNDYRPSLKEDKYRDKALESIIDINKLGELNSLSLADRLELFSKISTNIKAIEFYIENNGYSLNNILSSLKEITNTLEGDYKFAFAFDNSLQVIRKENVYVNNLLDKFSKKYEDSISLITELNMGLFEDRVDEFISRLNSVVKDSSVRDEDTQKELIAKVKDITANKLTSTSTSKIRELLKLLIDELIKDIRYSLFLIEDKVYKLTSDSKSRVSSFSTIKDISNKTKNNIQEEIEKSNKLDKNLFYILSKTEDIKYELLDNYEFIGKSKVKEKLLLKEYK